MESTVQNIGLSARRSTTETIESFEMNLKRVLLPTQIAGWISGFGIIEYPLGQPRPIISVLYSSVIYGSLLLLNIHFWYLFLLQIFVEQTGSSSKVFFTSFCLLTMSLFGIVILHWINQKKIKYCLRRLAEIKMEMKQLGYNENHVRAVRIQINQIVTVIIAVSLLIFQTIGSTLQNKSVPWIFIVECITIFILPIFCYLMNDIIFINYVTFIKWEFIELNDKMNELFSAIEGKLSTENSNDSLQEYVQDYCDSIKTTRRLHHHLVKLSRRVNNAYGVQILLSLIISTLILILTLYNVQNHITDLIKGHEFNIIIISSFMWSALFASKILAINLSCAHSMEKASEIGYVIMKLNIEALNERMELETRLFTMQLLQNPLTFTAEGFFALGHSCILLVISIITVYLFFLIQVSKTAIESAIPMAGMNNHYH